MKVIYRILPILVGICVPFLILMTSIRALMNPWYLQTEYFKPGFPPDSYGFTTQERLRWSGMSLKYLLNREKISYLGNLTFSNGMPLFNERELSHMLDVKILVQRAIAAWLILLAGSIITGAWSIHSKWKRGYWKGVYFGAWATIGLLVAIIIGVFTNFYALFENFHALFFTGDSWLFYTSDTLIRLFPEKFWSDAFLLVGAFSMILAIVAILVSAWQIRKSKSA